MISCERCPIRRHAPTSAAMCSIARARSSRSPKRQTKPFSPSLTRSTVAPIRSDETRARPDAIEEAHALEPVVAYVRLGLRPHCAVSGHEQGLAGRPYFLVGPQQFERSLMPCHLRREEEDDVVFAEA